jgi:hypothetical protein
MEMNHIAQSEGVRRLAYEFKKQLVRSRFKSPGQHLLQGVRPVLVVIRTDAYVVYGADLLGWEATDSHPMLCGRQGNEIGEAPIIAPLPSEHCEQGVVKPPGAQLAAAASEQDTVTLAC